MFPDFFFYIVLYIPIEFSLNIPTCIHKRVQYNKDNKFSEMLMSVCLRTSLTVPDLHKNENS